jgi:hypothetical protein
MDVVGVVGVGDGDVATVRAVLVPVLIVGRVLAGRALVDVLPVNPVDVAVVRVVGVVTVRERDMAAAFGVDVLVIGVRLVLAGLRHGGSPSWVAGGAGSGAPILDGPERARPIQ